MGDETPIRGECLDARRWDRRREPCRLSGLFLDLAQHPTVGAHDQRAGTVGAEVALHLV